jgi:hypothetical protein
VAWPAVGSGSCMRCVGAAGGCCGCAARCKQAQPPQQVVLPTAAPPPSPAPWHTPPILTSSLTLQRLPGTRRMAWPVADAAGCGAAAAGPAAAGTGGCGRRWRWRGRAQPPVRARGALAGLPLWLPPLRARPSPPAWQAAAACAVSCSTHHTRAHASKGVGRAGCDGRLARHEWHHARPGGGAPTRAARTHPCAMHAASKRAPRAHTLSCRARPARTHLGRAGTTWRPPAPPHWRCLLEPVTHAACLPLHVTLKAALRAHSESIRAQRARPHRSSVQRAALTGHNAMTNAVPTSVRHICHRTPAECGTQNAGAMWARPLQMQPRVRARLASARLPSRRPHPPA